MLFEVLLGSAVVFITVIFFVGVYFLRRIHSLVDGAWFELDRLLQERVTLVPQLITSVKQKVKEGEHHVVEKLLMLRSFLVSPTNYDRELPRRIKWERELAAALWSILNTEMGIDLDENDHQLRQHFSDIESKIQIAQSYYNGAAHIYITLVEHKPFRLIYYMGNYKPFLCSALSMSEASPDRTDVHT
ncbi:MAG: LemA family protein [Candidatus Babeliales bacterium]